MKSIFQILYSLKYHAFTSSQMLAVKKDPKWSKKLTLFYYSLGIPGATGQLGAGGVLGTGTGGGLGTGQAGEQHSFEFPHFVHTKTCLC